VERVRSRDAAIFHYENALTGKKITREGQDIPDYSAGIDMYFSCLLDPADGVLRSLDEIECVCFKTVLSKGHYGVHVIDDQVLRGMEEMLPVAPAHNVPYLEVIRLMQRLTPRAKLVGAFETAFHTTVPLERRLYGSPYAWYEKYGLMRMGYHGASHRYVAETVAARRGGGTGRLISCHLGGSSSLCAIEDGRSVDTSFGLSLQTGVIQAERTGDFDTFAVSYLMEKGLGFEDIMTELSKNGGLKGLSGVSGDLRLVEEAAASGNSRASLAIEVYVNGLVKTIGAFFAELGGLDAIAFAGGIGENSATVRGKVCSALRHMGVILNGEANERNEPLISAENSPVAVYIVPTDEEAVVSKQAYECLTSGR
jgi:acetate kinase